MLSGKTAVAKPFCFDRGVGIQYYTSLYTDQLFVSAEYNSDKVLDKVGDCGFMAGLIYGLSNDHSPAANTRLCHAAAFNKLFIPGDTTDQTVAR